MGNLIKDVATDLTKRIGVYPLCRKTLDFIFYRLGLVGDYGYKEFCLLAAKETKLFKNFKRNSAYQVVLEHTSEDLGAGYLEEIRKDPDILNHMDSFKQNDLYGNPLKCPYEGVGMISPSTFRYVKVLSDLRKFFHKLDDFSICEVGGGYGGQALIINNMYSPNEYTIVDIKGPLLLAKRYLSNFNISSKMFFKEMDSLEAKNYDLFVSNYAFSELPRHIQDVYLEKIIHHSKRGYITYNELQQPAAEWYRREELLKVIPGSEILEEVPLSHPKNCIIVWGHHSS